MASTPRKGKSTGLTSMDLDPSVVSQLVQNQAEDIALRKIELEAEQKNESKRLEISREDQKHQKEVALASISAQRQVVGIDIERKDKQNMRSYLFWGLTVILILAFMVISMYLGKEEFAETVIKIIGGGIGGYFIGSNKAKSDALKQKEDKE